MIRSFSDIDEAIKSKHNSKVKTLSIAAADDEHVLEAVCEANKAGIVDAILVGNKSSILKKAEEHGLSISGFEIIDCEKPNEAAEKAVELVKNGQADMIMKGLLDTSVFLKAILNKEKGLRSSDLLSYVDVAEVDTIGRLLFITDPAINLEPTLEEKEIIMHNAIGLSHALGNECPKVALIAPIEKVNDRMDSTKHAKLLVEKYKDSSNFVVGGPFGLDNAVMEEAAKIKGVDGVVGGKADILIFNDIGAGNVAYKSLVCFSHMKHGGITIGASAPVLMMSRADSTESKLNCIKLGILLSDYYKSLFTLKEA